MWGVSCTCSGLSGFRERSAEGRKRPVGAGAFLPLKHPSPQHHEPPSSHASHPPFNSLHSPIPTLPTLRASPPSTTQTPPAHRHHTEHAPARTPQAHYSATLRLKRFFPFTLIDAMGSLAETQEQITKELRCAKGGGRGDEPAQGRRFPSCCSIARPIWLPKP